MKALALADEELDPEISLQLADAGGHVRLHPVELFRGPGDAAGLYHGSEDFQIAQIHRSLHRSYFEMIVNHNYSFYVIDRPA